MKKTKKEKKSVVKIEKKLKNFRFPARGKRKACTIQAENLADAVSIYNQQ